MGYQLNSKDRLSLVYNFRYTKYFETPNNDYLDHAIAVEWKHQFSPYLVGILLGGVDIRNYRSNSLLSNFVDGYGGILVRYKTPRETVFEFVSRYGRNSLGSNSSFSVLNFDFKWQYRVFRRVYFRGTAFYQFNNFTTPAGIDEHVYGTSPAVQYRINKWLFVESTYDFIQRSSDFTNGSYTAHTAMAKIGAIFPIRK